MEAKYDILVWQQMLDEVSKHNNEIERIMQVQCLDRCNRIVVSDDFTYCVTADEKRCADVQFIGFSQEPVRMTEKQARHIAATFKAENGFGPIMWQVVSEREYYASLLKKNKEFAATLREAIARQESELITV